MSQLKQFKAFVGMSGGVDSSVAVALLKQTGYKVTGVFIKVWEPAGFACTWRDDRRDAMRVAAQLDVPLVTVDLSQEYEKAVVDYMISEYRAGRTPNPDVECNRAIKFGAFYHWAMENGADYVATGHYARSSEGGNLLQARDRNKDQSYFLWTLKREQLRKCLFPVGNYTKPEIRKLAKEFGLSTASKPDSQGLCFIGRLDLKKFLQAYIKPKKGKVIDESGRVIGEHNGAWFYTIGERHGFKLKRQINQAHYVVSKDVKKNILTVSSQTDEKERKSRQINQTVLLTGVNWLDDESLNENKVYQARIRHRGQLHACKLEILKNKNKAEIKVNFKLAPEAIASGQSLVIYDGEKCVAGGIIK